MNTLDVFRQKKREILRKIVHFFIHQEAPADLPPISEEISNISEDETTQMIHGFLEVIEKALTGDKEAAQDYLSLILPPLKSGGLSSSMIVRSVPAMFAIIAVNLGPDHLSWISQYSQEYMDALNQVWESA